MIDKEFHNLIPPLTTEEYKLLETSILTEGCRDPLVIWQGLILDGHNRYEICNQHGVEFKTREIEFADRDAAKVWIIQNQFARRNLTLFQRGELTLILEPIIARQAKERQLAGINLVEIFPQGTTGKTRDQLGAMTGVSGKTIDKVKLIVKEADEPTKEQLRKGEVSINKVYQGIRSKDRREQRVKQVQAQPLESLGIKANVVLCDPPWRYDYSKSNSRDIENQYPTMTEQELCKFEIWDILADDVVMFMWATSPKLVEALNVLNGWGFTYRTCMVWDKEVIGMGYYFRQQHEILLVATKGNLPVPEPETRVASVLRSPRGKHSEKPEAVYGIIERMYPEYPKVELFARMKREGWISWGNEIDT